MSEDLFSRAAARAARDEAVQTVSDGCDDQWQARAEAVVRRLAAIGPFTSDHVWAAIDHPRESRALGAILMRMRKAGVIVPTGRWVKSARVACHARELREWQEANNHKESK